SFLDAARDLLERQGVRVVGLASTSAEALRQSPELCPQVMLIDITLSGESGFELARRLADQCESSAVMILISTLPQADLADLIGESPAAGFLPKSGLSADAIRQIARGTLAPRSTSTRRSASSTTCGPRSARATSTGAPERTTPNCEQFPVAPEAEEHDGRVQQAVDVQRVHVLVRAVRVGEREVASRLPGQPHRICEGTAPRRRAGGPRRGCGYGFRTTQRAVRRADRLFR